MQNAHEMILEMIAWRDPNMIPIKAFYGDDLKVNFAGKLATDSHPMVRGIGTIWLEHISLTWAEVVAKPGFTPGFFAAYNIAIVAAL